MFWLTAWFLGEPSRDYLLGALVVFAVGAVRGVSWLLGAGSYSVVEKPEGLAVYRNSTEKHMVRWENIERVTWGGGSRFPAFDQPYSFPELMVDPIDADEGLVLQEIMVLGRRARKRTQRQIEECCVRHGVPCRTRGPDRGLLSAAWRRFRRRRARRQVTHH